MVPLTIMYRIRYPFDSWKLVRGWRSMGRAGFRGSEVVGNREQQLQVSCSEGFDVSRPVAGFELKCILTVELWTV